MRLPRLSSVVSSAAWVGLLALLLPAACGGGGDGGPGAPDLHADTGSDVRVTADVEAPDGAGETDVGAPPVHFEPVWWPVGDDSGVRELVSLSPFFAERPWLVREMSSWFHEVAHAVPGEEPADASHLGYFAAGNGAAFGFVGTYYPLNTLHELLGPEYQMQDGSGYFSDFRVRLRRDGALLPWRHEWVWRPRQAAIPLTRMQVDGAPLDLDTVVFAPMSDAPGAARNTLVQVIVVRNDGDAAVAEVEVEVASYAPAAATGAVFLEQLRGGDRLRVGPLDAGWTLLEASDEGNAHPHPVFRSPAITLEPGAERVFAMVYDFAEEADPIGGGRAAVEAAGWSELLAETFAWWQDWHRSGVVVRTPDWRVNDAIEGLKGTIRVQIAANGAASQMSHYTGVWQRDIYPPARVLARFGYYDDAWSIPDYLYGAATVAGGIGNALPADQILPDPLPAHDWRADLPFETDRLRGEGPSFVSLLHTRLWRYTGAGERLAERWDFLFHALRGQTLTPEGLMYFSGDETFRPAFAANIGLGLNYAFEHEAYSAYSAFLFVVACEDLARYATEAGPDRPDDIAWLLSAAAEIREATEALYWLETPGMYSPMIDMDSGVPSPFCSEDVNTLPLWIEYAPPDDARARTNIASCMDLILRDNAMLQNVSGLSETMLGVDLGQGIFAGTAPPSFLYNVARLNLELAPRTFDSLGTYLSPSGNLPEVGYFPEPGPAIAPMYDPASVIGELWSRYRLWEGSLALDALLEYLVGYDVDVTAGWLALAPHLPHDPAWVEADNLRYGEDFRLSMRWAEEADGYVLTLRPEGDAAAAGLAEVRLRLTVALESVAAVEVDGAPLALEDVDLRTPWEGAQELRLTLPPPTTATTLRVR